MKKILIVGGGGREHAIVYKLKEGNENIKLYCAPGNGGISQIAQCVDIKAMDIEAMVSFSKKEKMDLVIVAPDDPLAAGMVDALEAQGIRAFGPSKQAAEIESSKVFSKNLMKKYNIPTADYEVFDDFNQAIDYLRACKYPIVVKADGLALGKGVIIAESQEEAKKAVWDMMMEKRFGDSGNRVVVEEFMTGPEVSMLAFTDGKTIKPMVSSQDHKRAFDDDQGPNTGGMGTFSPSRLYTAALEEQCMREIYLPTIRAMEAENRPFKGVLFFGLMLTEDGPKVLEYNARFGDPETQVVLPRLKTNLLEIFEAIIDQRLESIDIEWEDKGAVCVVMASGGYPGAYETGHEISGLEDVEGIVFHAGTAIKDGKFVTAGGRVLGVTAVEDTLEEAIKKSYDYVDKITFKNAHYRRDIGKNK